MKPRILILMHYMELGGAESALLGLLQCFDTNNADVDLFVYDHRGDFFPLIPTEKINLLPPIESYSMFERPIVDVLRKHHLLIAILRIIGKIETVLCGGDESVIQGKWMSKALPQITNRNRINDECTYDLAISFVTPHYFVLDHVKAKKKVGWIHTDYSTLPYDTRKEIKMWERLDKVISISPDVTKTFLQVFPTLKEKIVVIENILSPEFVRHRAEVVINNNKNAFLTYVKKTTSSTNILLSIGRICPQKNFDNVPYIAKKMKDMGCKFHWYIIGPGEHSDIDKTIDETGTGDVITFLGAISNPYPYIKGCDFYLQPSRYEGKSITVREAQILCKPVVVTDYPTAPSQIKDGVDGVIVPMDNKECAKGIAAFIVDKQKQNQIISYLRTHDYGNEMEVEKIYDLVRM